LKFILEKEFVIERKSQTPTKDSDQEEEIQPQNRGRKGIIPDLAKFPRDTLIDENSMAKIFGVHSKTIQRMVTRHELPPPMRILGRHMWITGRVLDWFNNMAEKAEKDAKRLQEKLRKLNP